MHWAIVLCISVCISQAQSAEAVWEFPQGLIPTVHIRVPLKIINFDEFINKWEPPVVSGVEWHGIKRGGHFTQIINGVKKEEQTIFVTISFSKEGSYTIPAVKLFAQSGASIQTKPITLTGMYTKKITL